MRIDPLSIPIRILYHQLLTEVFDIHYRWKLFARLYNTDQETINLLEESAPYFFRVLYFDLLDAIAVAFGRLLDPAESFRNKNASMQQLVDLLGEIDPEVNQRLEEHLTEARKVAKRIMEWRNKIAAHKDYRAAISQDAKIGYNPADVDNSLKELDSFINEFQKHFSDPPLTLDPDISDDEKIRQVTDFEKHKVEFTGFDDILFVRGNPEDLVTLLKWAKSGD